MAHGTSEQRAFWSKVLKSEYCWLWQGTILNNGYGQITINYQKYLVHRWAYTDQVGPIPEGLVLDHLCRNRRCVRPDHLETVTLKENVLRGEGVTAKFAVALECVNGHPLVEDNVRPRKGGGRDCRTCKNRRQREYMRRKKEREKENIHA